jgi:hypothetical protein
MPQEKLYFECGSGVSFTDLNFGFVKACHLMRPAGYQINMRLSYRHLIVTAGMSRKMAETSAVNTLYWDVEDSWGSYCGV